MKRNVIYFLTFLIFTAILPLKAENSVDFVTKLYIDIMNRTPSQKEVDYWNNKLKEGKSATYVLKAFFKSKEYRNKNYDDENYVTALYKVLLEREPDKEGLDYWVSQIEDNNIHRTQIFYKFLFSPEFKDLMENKYHIKAYTKEDKLKAFIERFYNLLFNRDAEYGGIEYWKEQLLSQDKSASEMANYFFFSKEFESKNYSDKDFIKLAYRTLLDREADKGGLDFWLSLLEKGVSKREIIKQFISSEEFIKLLDEYGLNEQNKNGVPDFAKPIGKIKELPKLYGKWGKFKVKRVSFAGDFNKDITIFYPENQIKAPTIFFSPGWYDNNSISYKKYEVLLNFIASKGFAAVFVPYTRSYKLYKEVRRGFLKAAINYPNIIDTSRVGFIGFSAGGGIITSISYYLYKNYGWGEKGRFLFYLSPWYDFGMEEYEDKGESLLANYPSNTKIIMQRYDKDEDDPRTLIDIYRHINIPNSEKDFIIVPSSSNYPAIHTIPYSPLYSADVFDYFVIFKFIDALSQYTFFNDLKAKNVALGDGSKEQTYMPKDLNSLIVTDYPEDAIEIEPFNYYTYPCNRDINPRKDFCSDFTAE